MRAGVSCREWREVRSSMRAPVGIDDGRPRGVGIYPACAGEPGGTIPLSSILTVYPRVCGGTDATTGASKGDRGLSPRVRGNLVAASDSDAVRRSIPACAGEPRARSSDRPGSEVYPRVCGGTPTCTRHELDRVGLSPRVRGNQPIPTGPPVGGGSIPACAGEPYSVGDTPKRLEVYPRVCGGTWRGYSSRVCR